LFRAVYSHPGVSTAVTNRDRNVGWLVHLFANLTSGHAY
jgi:hypothetical protein